MQLGPELLIALAVGSLCALVIPKEFMEKVDEFLINAISIVIGAAVAGLSLTAAAARPQSLTVHGARRLGAQLKLQIGFWFGFVKFGGVAVLLFIIGRGLGWELPFSLPRPAFVPAFVPTTGAWLIFLSTGLMAFVVARVPKIISAMCDLIELGTTQHIEAIVERNKADQQVVSDQISNTAPDTKAKIVTRPRVSVEH